MGLSRLVIGGTLGLVRPGDHPEFFTRPPPEGRSRESRIVVDREGRFWHEGRLVEHRGMAEAFASWIDRHPHDGRYVLNNGYDWSYVTVEDAPLTVRTLHGGSEPWVELNDGSREPLDASSVRVGDDGVTYCSVRGGRLMARFSRAAQLALAPYLDQDSEGRLVLRLSERSVEVDRR